MGGRVEKIEGKRRSSGIKRVIDRVLVVVGVVVVVVVVVIVVVVVLGIVVVDEQ